MKKNKEKYINYAIILIVTIILMLPVFKGSLINTNDGKLHLLRILGVVDSIKSGMFPPVISPNYMNTWGYGINIFYNPLTTYGPMIFRLISGSYTIAIKIFMAISMFCAGLFMYKFTKEVTKNKNIALISSIIYITTPYYLCNIYTRGAIAEFVALTFIPLLFLGLYNLLEGDGSKHYCIAVGATLLLLTHNITTLYTAIFCVIYLIFNIQKIKDKNKIKLILINVLFIILSSLFFIVPLITNKMSADYTIFETSYIGASAESVNKRGVDIKELFYGYTETGINVQIGIANLVGIVLAIFLIKKIKGKYTNTYTDFLILGLIAVLMSLKYFPWFAMPKILTMIQFPWRLIGLAGFFLSFVAAVGMMEIAKKLLKNNNLVDAVKIPLVCLIVLMATLQTFTLEKDEEMTDIEYEQMRKNNMQVLYYQINREYLPKKAFEKLETYLSSRDDKIKILNGYCKIENETKSNLYVEANVTEIAENTAVEMPFLYYAGYKAYIVDENNSKEKLDVFESENGFVSINLEKTGTIMVKYATPISYYVAIIISISGITSLTIYIFVYNKKFKLIENVEGKKDEGENSK